MLRYKTRNSRLAIVAAVVAACSPDVNRPTAPASANRVTLGDGPNVKRVGTPANLPGPTFVELVTGQIIDGECHLREYAKRTPGQYTIFVEYDKVACKGVAGHFDWNRQLDAQIVTRTFSKTAGGR
jgi:hypothetical protein